MIISNPINTTTIHKIEYHKSVNLYFNIKLFIEISDRTDVIKN